MVFNRHVKMPLALATLVIFLISGLIISFPGTPVSSAPELPKVGSKAQLLELLKGCQDQLGYRDDYLMMAPETGAVEKSAAEAAPSGLGSADANDYSSTNTQVEGVDEADLVKTDGQYIYQVNGKRLLIINAYPANQMAMVSQISLNDPDFTPMELYVDGDQLVVIGQYYTRIPIHQPYPAEKNIAIYPPQYTMETTRAIVYDIHERSMPSKVREVELEGNYLSSRKVGSSLYLVSNRYLNWYWIQNNQYITPRYRDSALGGTMTDLDYNKISYCPGYVYPNFVMVAGVNLADSSLPAQVESFLGNGDNIYASPQKLYVALSDYNYNYIEDSAVPSYESKTLIHCFNLDYGQVSYAGQGEVPGTIINQFSMDEYQGNFRIATTTGELWGSGDNISQNNVFVLDQNLQVIGRLTGIAPGEKIYSTRFMGNRAYMVTFRNVDPFFVIDMSTPEQPLILGKLKIPGYSDYLHPYDENHIIGFGKDTVEIKNNSGGSQAYYQGLKLALFDVSNVNNPVEISRSIIGARGSDSELLRNHKALLFSREKNLLAFPATVMELDNPHGSYPDSALEYGTFAFQGAYIYNIDLQNGLQLRGRVSHLSAEDYMKAGDYWYESGRNIQRILYINDTLYTLSDEIIETFQLSDLTLTNSLHIPVQ